jgi:hypothetical protein
MKTESNENVSTNLHNKYWNCPPSASKHSCARLSRFMYTRVNSMVVILWMLFLMISLHSSILPGFCSYTRTHLKGRVYEQNPHNIEELKDTITNSIRSITTTELTRVYMNLLRRAQECLDADGGQFQR